MMKGAILMTMAGLMFMAVPRPWFMVMSSRACWRTLVMVLLALWSMSVIAVGTGESWWMVLE